VGGDPRGRLGIFGAVDLDLRSSTGTASGDRSAGAGNQSHGQVTIISHVDQGDETSMTRVEEQQHTGVLLRRIRAVEELGRLSLHGAGSVRVGLLEG
jgi:hypothetical protein